MSRHIKALDGIRGLAILLVLFGHLVPYHQTSALIGKLVNGFAGIGWSGVSLFFVLSGYLITGILSDSKTGPDYLRNFYVRRALRIFPLYYLVVFLCIVVLPHFSVTASAKPAQDSWMYWLYISNYHDAFHAGVSDGWLGPLWSLAVEEHFYLIWPAVILFTTRRGAIKVCGVCILLATAFRIWFIVHGQSNAPYIFTPCRMDDLAAGGLTALLVRSEGGVQRLARIARVVAPIAGGFALGLTVWKHAVIWNPVLQLAGLPLFTAFFASMLVLGVAPQTAGWWKWVLETRFLRTFGKYSYALYVFHPAVSALMLRTAFFPESMGRANDLLNAVILITITLVVAWISWNLYEKRFLSLKRFFEYARPTEVRDHASVKPTEALVVG